MSGLALPVLDDLWRLALAIVPMVVLVALATRVLPCRPTTRHLTWIVVLLLFLVAPILPKAPVGDLIELVPENAPGAVALARPMAPERTETHAEEGAAADHAVDDRAAEAAEKERPATPPLAATAMRRPGDADEDVDPESTGPGDRAANPQPSPSGRRPVPPPMRPPGAGAAPSETEALPAEPRAPPARHAGLPERAPRAVSGVETSSNPNRVPTFLDHPASSVRGEGSLGGRWMVRSDERTGVKDTPARDVVPTGVRAAGDGAAAPTAPHREIERPARALAPIWEGWITAVVASARVMRDAVMRLPALPGSVWAAGALIVALVALVRIVLFQRLLRRAAPAPHAIEALVRDAAAHIGLAGPPDTRITDDRISPMVWCGRRTVLLLPAALWRQLDDAGRRAVVQHELAHLRRRDHWLCWLTLVAGCVYWWHPVVWWVNRRIREEADLCCDAWVTDLMPSARRSYATALVQTKRFTSRAHPALPAVALGVSTLRAKRLARRITMVMTKQMTPRLSLTGAALAGLVAVGCWLVTPTLACPPEDRPAAKAPKHRTVIRLAPTTRPASRDHEGDHDLHDHDDHADHADPDDHADESHAGSTFEHFMRGMQGGDRGDMSLEERIQQLEQQIDHLVERLLGEMQGRLPHAEEIMGRVGQWLERMEIPQLSEMEFGMDMPDMPEIAVEMGDLPAGGVFMFDESAPGRYSVALAAPDCACVGGAGECDCETTVRSYRLSAGKLKDITTLMSRSDVPVFITPHDDRIDVHGTPAQHRSFAAFARMIDPEHAKHNQPPQPKLAPSSGVPGKKSAGPKSRGAKVDDYADRAANEQIGSMRAVLADHAAHRDALKQEMSQLRQVMRDLDQERRGQERAAKQVAREAQNMERQAERAIERAERLVEQAQDREGADRDELMDRAKTMRREAEALMDEAAALEDKAEQIEAAAEDIDAHADEIEERMESLEEAIHEIAQAAEEIEARLAEAIAGTMEKRRR